jgi:hypothetical protein
VPTLSVGQPYIQGRASLDPRAEYNFRGGQHELLLCLRGLTAREVEAVRSGEAEFGLVLGEDVLFLLYRFGEAIRWSDAPYTWHLVPAGEREPPARRRSGESRALLTVVLVDADRNLVRALRALTLSPEFTRTLHAAIRRQAARVWTAEAYDAELRRAYARWPTSEAMLPAATVRCIGGA